LLFAILLWTIAGVVLAEYFCVAAFAQIAYDEEIHFFNYIEVFFRKEKILLTNKFVIHATVVVQPVA